MNENMEKSKGCFWVPVFGIISVVLVFLGVILAGGGHGGYTLLFIAASPLTELMPLAEGWFITVLFLIPFYWMGEVVLALCHNKYCKWAFLLGVPGKYIYTLIFIFTWDTRFQHFPGSGIGVLLFVAILYIAVQLLLWVLFLKTWDVWDRVNEVPQ